MGVDRREPELARLLERRIPAVAVDLDVTGERVGYVTSDNVAGARLAVRHLHGLGHRRIATVTGPPELPPGGDRIQGIATSSRLSASPSTRTTSARATSTSRAATGRAAPCSPAASVRRRCSRPAT